jgi:ABC-type Zn uptake system ZnuABC Zn-binding protein ZnuA
VELIKAQGVRTILQEIFYDRSAADYLAQQTGVHVVTLPLDLGPEVGVTDYFGLIDHLLDSLIQSEKGNG